MKRLFLQTAVALTLLTASANAAETFQFDPNHTSIWWHANHFGFSNPGGRFTIQSGDVMLDEADPKNSKVDVVIDVNSLVTGIDKFNTHIKSPDFLDAAKYPTATFRSTKVDMTGKDTAKVTGDLTLHGVTKPEILDVKLNKIGEHPMTHKKAVGFTASTVIKRSDFGVTKYIPGVSDDVRIDIEAEGQAQ